MNTTVTSGSAQSVGVSLSGAPPGVTGTFAPTSVNAGGSSQLTFTVAGSVTAGRYPVSVTGTAAVAAHTATVTLTVIDPVAPAPPSVPGAPRTIDLPAADQEFPTNAVVNVKTTCGARGDGTTDDTTAIQACISAGLGMDSSVIPRKTLFFPKGTYLISNTLYWKLANGDWSTSLTLQGENRDQTIIKLENSAPGFNDAANPRAVLFTASQNSSASDGSGNQAFNNFIFDLTVDVGQGNPGAVGIDYLANNRGAIRNVVVQAPAGSGQTGIAINRPWPGPCLLKDVRVVGFGVGIQVTQPEYSVTMDNIDLRDQRTTGLSNTDNEVSVENLTSTNAVPAVVNTDPRGMMTLVGASLVGGSGTYPAVENQGEIYISRTHQPGLSDSAVRACGRHRQSVRRRIHHGSGAGPLPAHFTAIAEPPDRRPPQRGLGTAIGMDQRRHLRGNTSEF